MRLGLVVAGAALTLGVACSGEQLPYAGGLMIAVQTDLSAPKDVAAVGLYITSDGRPIFGDTRNVAPNGDVRFPATIAVIADPDRPRAVVKIRAVAFKENGDVRVLRDVITTIPKGRTALLRTPLLWINEGSGSGNRSQLLQSASIRPLDATSDGFARLGSACPDGQTFIDGDCADAHVNGDALPDYADKDVFGGGDPSGNGGRCFDVLACFADATPVALDMTTCTGTIAGVDPNDPNLSFAVALLGSAQAGECANGTCLVPLDKGSGWKANGAAIEFPRPLCRRIADGRASRIVASRACPTKDTTTPSCGPASSVNPSGSSGAGGDAGGSSTQDFEKPLAFAGEPNLSDISVDSDYLFLARAEQNPPPAGVVRVKKADVIALKNPPEISVLFGYASAPQRSAIALDPSPSAKHVVVRGEAGEVRLCTPTSANDCQTVNVAGPPEALAAGPDEAYAYGAVASELGLYAIPFASPSPVLRPVLPGAMVSTMLYSNGALYIGTVEAAILKCAMPCEVADSMSQLRAPSAVPAIVTKIAANDKVPGKIFFMQVPADAQTAAAGGIYELDLAGGGEFKLAAGEELGGVGTSPNPPSALAVDSEYVYWGGGFDDPRGGGRKSGLLRRNHVTRAAAQPLLEDVQGTEPVSAVAVDDTHAFWTFYRADRALMFAKKTRSF